MALNKKIRRTMLANKAQYFGSAALIAISCLLFTMFNGLTENMNRNLLFFVNNYVQEDASFITDKKLSNLPELEARFQMSVEEGGSFDYTDSRDKTLRIFAETGKVNLYAVTEGDKLSGNDMVIDPAFAKANGIKIGDSIEILGRSFRVSGTMSLPNYIFPLKKESDLINNANNFGVAVIARADFEQFQQGSRFYGVKDHGASDDSPSRLSELKAYLKDQGISILKWTNTEDNVRVSYVTDEVKNLKTVGFVLPAAILLLTCLLTGITLWRMLKREAVIMGMLYAQGYRKAELYRHYLAYAIFLAASGGIVGALLGIAAFKPLLDFYISYFNIPVGTVIYSAKVIAMSVVLPVTFLAACGYFVVRRALKSSPVALLKGGRISARIGFFEKKARLDKLGFRTAFKIRAQLRNIPRSLFLLLGVAFATMLLLMGFALKNSVDHLLKVEAVYKYQYEYVFSAFRHTAPTYGEAFSLGPFAPKSDDKKDFVVYGVNPATKYVHLEDKKGNLLSFNKVVITKPLATRMNIKEHDRIELVSKLDSKAYTITVDSIADSYIGEYIYMPLTEFNEMLHYPQDSYLGIWSQEQLDFAEDTLVSSSSIQELQEAYDALTLSLRYALGAIAFLAFIIGLLVLYVVTSLVIEESKENIALMKVLGYRQKEIYSLVLNSSTFIVLLGFALGVPLMLALLKAMFQSVAANSSFNMPVRIDYIYILAGFAVIYLIYELSKALSRKKINRIGLTEALKSGGE